MFKKLFATIFLTTILLISSVSSAFAASGYEGYAIHRDGALGGLNWHAGLMNTPKIIPYASPVVHITNINGPVVQDTWDNFILDDTFKGVYRPNSGITSTGRDSVIGMGRVLTTEGLGYTPLCQIDYYMNGTWVESSELTSIRCDGVVEYCYEWYGYRIFGSDSYWDITRSGLSYWNAHSGTAVTPQSQAQNYMTLVTSSIPY
ncbi:hypothetical protein [Dehalobacter sp. 14DCB1]|uniref:hypothetical protein n=1 Tax=Dehalobacter sp. 14DCB1 TaxID=2070227 RepID=UPI0010494611|nr:hypothetical protein [Dehalobacter sp. 14DCB1]TCX48938.1 hypothetical protein C1I36_12820 [Dehalobacter sp. 14DCB1]